MSAPAPTVDATSPVAEVAAADEVQLESAPLPMTEYAPGSVPEPKWIEDKEMETCQLCTNKFSMSNRKHHCRACGKVVCGDCSKMSWVFDDRSTGKKAQRVDDLCFRGLCTANPDVTPPVGGLTPKQKEDAWNLTLTGVGRFSWAMSRGLRAVGPKPKEFCTCDVDLSAHEQDFFYCLTCDPAKAEGVCYSCSVTCHGAHSLHPVTQHRAHVCRCDKKSNPCQIKGGLEREAFQSLRKARLSERLEREKVERDAYVKRVNEEAQARVAEALAQAAAMNEQGRKLMESQMAANQAQIAAHQAAAQK